LVTELKTSRRVPVLSPPPPPQTVTLRVTTAGSVTTANAEQFADLTREDSDDDDDDEDPDDESEKLKSVSWIV